jgi:hypothetical protein
MTRIDTGLSGLIPIPTAAVPQGRGARREPPTTAPGTPRMTPRMTLRMAPFVARSTGALVMALVVTLAAPSDARAQAGLAEAAGATRAAPAAQPANPAGGGDRSDPVDPGVAVPALLHRSAFDRYRAMSDENVGSWRDANDLVGRIGGWRAYAREAHGLDGGTAAPAGAAPATPATPATVQGGHRHGTN